MILAVLAEGPLHGYGMIKAVDARASAGVQLDPANLYRALRRLRALGWIDEADGADERRRTHRITKDGRAVLRAELGRLEALLAQARPAVSG